MNKKDMALGRYRGDFNCAQSVLSAYAEDFDLKDETTLKIATGLGAGMGRMGDVCGAVTGAILVLGMKYGMTDAERQEDKEQTYNFVRKFAEKFSENNGSIVCRELLGCDISTPSGFEEAVEKNLMETVCEGLIEDAVAMLEKLL